MSENSLNYLSKEKINVAVLGAAGGAIANAELFVHTYGYECGLNTGGQEVNDEKDRG